MSDKNTILGQITAIHETKTFGGGFRKTEMRMNIGSAEHPNVIALFACGKRADLPAKFKVGDNVSVAYWLNGREWETRCFTELSIAEISPISIALPDSQEKPAPAAPPPQEQVKPVQSVQPQYDLDNMPF